MNVKLSPDASQRLTRLAIEERRSAADQVAIIVERELKRTERRPELARIEATQLKGTQE